MCISSNRYSCLAAGSLALACEEMRAGIERPDRIRVFPSPVRIRLKLRIYGPFPTPCPHFPSNRVRSFRAERLRADVRSMASDAMATLQGLISGPDVPPSVRLWASLAILDAANAMKPETIGSASARGVKAVLDHRALLESIGG
jgi:hypothetical protein